MKSSRSLFLLGCLVQWNTFSSNGQTMTVPRAQLAEAIARLQAGDPKGALAQINSQLARQPGNCQLLSLRAVSFVALQDTEDALRGFQAALRRCPAYLPALEGLAQLKFQKHDLSSVQLLERILLIEPRNNPAHAMLASLYASTKDCVRALPHFEQSSALVASQPSAQQSYGRCLLEVGDLSKAITQFRVLMESLPTDVNRYNLAVLLWRNHEGQEALSALDPMLAEQKFAPAFALASTIAEANGDTLRAVGLLRTAIVLEPDERTNYLDFAVLAFTHSSFDVGIDMLNVGLNRLPSAAELYLARGVLGMQVARQQEAIADFEKAHQIDPSLSLTTDAMGIAKSQQHSDGDSLSLYRTEITKYPKDGLLHYLLAEQIMQGTDRRPSVIDEAIVAAKVSVNLEPSYEPAHLLLASLYLDAESPQLALDEANAVLVQHPDDEGALYHAMMANRRLHKNVEVKSLVKRLQEARSHHAETQRSTQRFLLVEEKAP